MSLVRDAPNLVLDFEMYNPKVDSHSKDEGELNVAKRLLSRVISTHKSFVDIVTYKAAISTHLRSVSNSVVPLVILSTISVNIDI